MSNTSSMMSLGKHLKETAVLGFPVVLGQLGIIAVGIADNVMIGQYGTLELAASSFVNNVFNLPIFMGLGFAYGLTPLVGKQMGLFNYRKIGELLKNSLYLNLIVGILLTIFMVVTYLCIDFMKQPGELLPMIKPYFILQLFSLVPLMIFNGYKQFSDGINRTKISMWILVGASAVNIVLNYIFIYGELGFPELGLFGAGLATLVARILMPIIFYFVIIYNKHYRRYLLGLRRDKITKSVILSLTKMGGLISLQMGMETLLFSFSAVMIGWIGTVELAAHQILVVISALGFMIYSGIGAAITIRISNFHVKKNWVDVRKAGYAGFVWISLLGLVFSVLLLVFKNHIGGLFNDSLAVNEIVVMLVVIMVIYQFSDAVLITFSNALRGISDVTALVIICFVGYFVIALPSGYYLAFELGYGIKGVWLGFPIGLTISGFLMYFRFVYLTRKEKKRVELGLV